MWRFAGAGGCKKVGSFRKWRVKTASFSSLSSGPFAPRLLASICPLQAGLYTFAARIHSCAEKKRDPYPPPSLPAGRPFYLFRLMNNLFLVSVAALFWGYEFPKMGSSSAPSLSVCAPFTSLLIRRYYYCCY